MQFNKVNVKGLKKRAFWGNEVSGEDFWKEMAFSWDIPIPPVSLGSTWMAKPVGKLRPRGRSDIAAS